MEYEERRRKKAEDKKRLAESRAREQEEARIRAKEEAQAAEEARLQASQKKTAPASGIPTRKNVGKRRRKRKRKRPPFPIQTHRTANRRKTMRQNPAWRRNIRPMRRRPGTGRKHNVYQTGITSGAAFCGAAREGTEGKGLSNLQKEATKEAVTLEEAKAAIGPGNWEFRRIRFSLRCCSSRRKKRWGCSAAPPLLLKAAIP